MKILTFDIEDWYNCDFRSQDFGWDKYEVRIYEGVDRILSELDSRNIKATFFCLGWIAERHPKVIQNIYKEGHHIGCHSYQHELSFRFTEKQFKEDTLKAKCLLEDITGVEVDAFRAPGFSITKNNVWALTSLLEMGFKYDCSIFPANHDYGGMPSYGNGTPKLIDFGEGQSLKEFPMSTHRILNRDIVFSGGGFFRLFPYFLINKWAGGLDYMMTYFHPRDFDPDQPIVENLSPIRKIKSYIGLKSSFKKFQRLLDNYEFVNILDADKVVDWDSVPKINIKEL